MKLLAIDPGSSGSAALFDGRNLLDVISFAHTPRYWNVIYRWYWMPGIDRGVKERVGGWAGQGGKSQFTFGWSDGAAFAAADICDIPIDLVEATWWQRRLGLPHHYEIDNRDKRRRACKKDQRAFCVARWPELAKFDKVMDTTDGGRERPDIWQSLCIGLAKSLDLEGVPLGQLG